LQGFDEFMNVVIDEAAEVYIKDAKPRRELGVDNAVICSFVNLTTFTHRSDTTEG
jgi:small nuclear ribonucleoprotein (snRNP)-like protein